MFETPSKESIQEIIEYREGKLYWKKKRGKASAGFRCGTATSEGRRQTCFLGLRKYNFNIVWFLHTGDWSAENPLMPKDGDNDNEAFENLEQRKQNKEYRSKDIEPLIKAFIQIGGTQVYLGTYYTENEKFAAMQGADRVLKIVSDVKGLAGTEEN